MSLAHIPKGMLDKIRRKCFNFFWTDKWDKEGIPLVNGANKKNKKRQVDGASKIFINFGKHRQPRVFQG